MAPGPQCTKPLGYETYRVQGLNAMALRAESPKVCETI